MAIQKSITDSSGTTHTEAYTMLDAVGIDRYGANVMISIFHNAAARSKDDLTSMKEPIYTSATAIKGSAFTTYLSDSALSASGKTPLNQAYAWLKTVEEFGIDWTTGTSDV